MYVEVKKYRDVKVMIPVVATLRLLKYIHVEQGAMQHEYTAEFIEANTDRSEKLVSMWMNS